jgi:hypothetical protein
LVGGLLGIFGVSWAFIKDKALTRLATESVEAIKKLEAVRDKKSPGGKKITSEEAQELVKEVYDVFEPLKEMITKYLPRLAKKLGLDK